jgi:hypothetical protein
VRPDLLLRLLLELTESAHALAVFHHPPWRSQGLRHPVPWDAADKVAGVVTDNLSVLSGSGARFEQLLNGG